MTFWETVSVALITAITSTFLTTYWQRLNEQIKFSRDKLFDRYSDFIATASADLDRAKKQAAIASIGQEQDYTALDQSTHQAIKSNHAELARLSLQIRLLESNEVLKQKVKQIEKSQPFMVLLLPPKWNDPLYQERFNKFESEINLFEKNLSDLADAVLANRKLPPKCFLHRWFCN